MAPSRALSAKRIHPAGWILVGFRLLLMALLLVLCVPLHGLWRLIGAGRFWPRVFLTGIGAIAGLQIEVRGRARPGALLLGNHVSWLDIPALAQTAGSAFVAHEGLAAFPFLKWLCEMNDTVFIARDDRASIARQVGQVREAMADCGSLTIFPEGTTSDGVDLHSFKSSLLSALDPLPPGVVVQPVALRYEDSRGMAWVGEEHGLDNFKRILARLRPIRLEVVFLPPLTGEALADRKAMALASRQMIVNALRV